VEPNEAQRRKSRLVLGAEQANRHLSHGLAVPDECRARHMSGSRAELRSWWRVVGAGSADSDLVTNRVSAGLAAS